MTNPDLIPAKLSDGSFTQTSGPTLPPVLAAALNAPRDAVAHPCGHPDGCTNTATHQFGRDATLLEAEAHWTAVEGNIRASNDGHPAVEYVADRTDTVTIAEHRCDDHGHPLYLEAKAREETGDV
jgi:hypothetical protein